MKSSIDRIMGVKFPCKTEIILVNDGSTDGSLDIAMKYKSVAKIIDKPNGGKGSALTAGIRESTGSIITFHDADLEYNPSDLSALISYMLENDLDVVYGRRPFDIGMENAYTRNVIGNYLLSKFASMVYRSNISDIETCYKVFRSYVLKGIEMRSKSFDFEVEVTAKTIMSGHDIRFKDISYNPRSYEEGKKIRVYDGLKAAKLIIKYRIYEMLERRFRNSRISVAMPEISNGDKLFDIGCGTCLLMRRMKDAGMGVEYSGFDPKIGRIGSGNKFNIVTMLAVLEHTESPESEINNAVNSLLPGGKLLITVPTKRALIPLEILKRLRLVSAREIDEHKRYYTKESLENLLNITGMEHDIRSYNLGMNLAARLWKT